MLAPMSLVTLAGVSKSHAAQHLFSDVGLMISALAQIGVRTVPMSGRIRMITHRDVSAADIAEALARIAQLQA